MWLTLFYEAGLFDLCFQNLIAFHREVDLFSTAVLLLCVEN